MKGRFFIEFVCYIQKKEDGIVLIIHKHCPKEKTPEDGRVINFYFTS